MSAVPADTGLPAAGVPPSTVIVVTSNASARSRVLGLLESEDIEAYACTSGAQVRELLGAVSCDALIVDYMLDDMCGLELLVETDRCGVAPAVLVIAGRGEVSAAVRALRAGASDFLPAPIDARLLRSLRQALARRRATAGG